MVEMNAGNKVAVRAAVTCIAIVLIAISCLSGSAYADSRGAWPLGAEAIAAQDEGSPALSAEDAAAKAGETVDVEVRISNNPGILGATLEIRYDSQLVLTGIANGDAFKSLDMTKPGEMVSGCKVHWDATDVADSDVKDGVIATLTFVVPTNADSDDSYLVEVAGSTTNGQPDVYDRDFNSVNVQPAQCRITVEADAPHVEHTYGSWKTVTEATCTESGLRERVCIVCGEKETEEISALGHSWDTGTLTQLPTCTASGTRTFACVREGCGETRQEIEPAYGHLWGDWTVVKEPTNSEPGLRQRVCEHDQSHVESQEIEKLGGDEDEQLVSLNNAVVTPSSTSYAYDGTAHEPVVTVTLPNGTAVPASGYDVSYANNTNVGTATVTVTGKGDYTGSKSATFKVNAASLAAASVTLSPTSYTYDGHAKQPSVTVRLGSATLRQGTDYDVSYSDNTNVGTATATVTGKGNYAGTARATFAIAAAQPSGGTSGSADGGSGSSGASQPAQPAQPTVQPQAMHRLYNPHSGEHFYTADEGERDAVAAAGWKYEGIGWTAPETSNTPVYRLYNKYGGEHHYCTDKGEHDALVAAGWADEGIGWYSDDAKSVPLYREYNPNAFANNHNYTTDKAEHEWLLSLGWKDEGRAWYGVK